ncbi:probable arginine--tRNA ligase, mitochondrial [Asterias rubens]|uniref:probable arginine--tRNA ligase, mitochondrial n=1 Tax=Asterias rubens TaxID=7604 RepID=UPI001455ADD8|nr:probable arginine--tRNA ligase, mitochondrial [Asterias rubens]
MWYLRKGVAKATGYHENSILPLISPLPATKRRPVVEYGLSLKSIFQKNSSSKNVRSSDGLQRFAGEIASKIACPAHIHHIHVAGGGLVTFEVNPSLMVQKVLEQVQTEGRQYGVTPEPWEDRQEDRVIIEYSSPNIAKPFHAGHLRSTLIGNCIANLHSALGHNVTRVNYLGDWGVQFGLLGVGFQRFGSEEKLSSDPIQHLFDVYVQVNREADTRPDVYQEAQRFTRAMEEGDDQCLSIWRRFRELSIKEYTSTYTKLGVAFDVYEGESQYLEKAKNLLQLLNKENLLHISERGTGVVNLESLSHPQHKCPTLMKSDGSSLYLTRDIAAAMDRYERYTFDKIHYVVDKSQEVHFSQMKGVLKKLNVKCANRVNHVKFGRVLGMQTRKGNVVLLQDILEEAKRRMLSNMQEADSTKELSNPGEVAEVLGVSAMIVQDLRCKLMSDYKFDWERILTSQGDTGVFLQYTHARLYSIEHLSGVLLTPDCDMSTLCEPEAILLANHISLFSTAIMKAHAGLEPCHLVNYLLQLCHFVSTALNTLRVKGTDRDQAEARLLLFNSTRKTLSNGMKILGLTPLEKM